MQKVLSMSRRIFADVSDYDFTGQIKASAILDYFQNLAASHAESLGVGFDALAKKNMLWVLSRVSAVILSSPIPGESITVHTKPHKPGMAEAIRDFRITSKNKPLILGSSRWCVLDTQSRAIRRCAPLFSYPDSAYTTDSAQVGEGAAFAWEDVAVQEICAFKNRVLLSDIDTNGHMNNARYADMVYNACTLDMCKTKRMKAFEFWFLAEMRYGDAYTVVRKDTADVSYFEVRGEGGPACRAKIIWRQ